MLFSYPQTGVWQGKSFWVSWTMNPKPPMTCLTQICEEMLNLHKTIIYRRFCPNVLYWLFWTVSS